MDWRFVLQIGVKKLQFKHGDKRITFEVSPVNMHIIDRVVHPNPIQIIKKSID